MRLGGERKRGETAIYMIRQKCPQRARETARIHSRMHQEEEEEEEEVWRRKKLYSGANGGLIS